MHSIKQTCYVKPKIEILELEKTDIITDSDPNEMRPQFPSGSKYQDMDQGVGKYSGF